MCWIDESKIWHLTVIIPRMKWGGRPVARSKLFLEKVSDSTNFPYRVFFQNSFLLCRSFLGLWSRFINLPLQSTQYLSQKFERLLKRNLSCHTPVLCLFEPAPPYAALGPQTTLHCLVHTRIRKSKKTFPLLIISMPHTVHSIATAVAVTCDVSPPTEKRTVWSYPQHVVLFGNGYPQTVSSFVGSPTQSLFP